MSFSRGRRAPHLAGVVVSLAVALVATLALAAPAAATTGTYVRLAQLAEETAGWELTVAPVGGSERGVVVPGRPFGGLSEYVRVDPGDYIIGLRPASGGDPAQVVGALTATAGSAYTVAALGAVADRELRVLTDDLSPPARGQAKVRVIGALTDDSLAVGIGGQAVAPGLRAGEPSGYVTVPAGPVPLRVGATELQVELRPNEIGTVVVVPAGGGLAAELHRDAAAPSTVPRGAVAAGPGGADHDRSGVVTLVGLAVLGLAVAAVLRVRRRQARRAPEGPTS